MNRGKRTKKLRPLPIELSKPLTLSEVDLHTNWDCPIYELCLAYAARRAWKGFSCRFCPFFSKGSLLEELKRIERERKGKEKEKKKGDQG